METDSIGVRKTLEYLNAVNLLEPMLATRGGGEVNRLLWGAGDPVYAEDILGDEPKRPVLPRCVKARSEQKRRTRGHAEVFTSPETVRTMIDALERENPELEVWTCYATATFCEITCGEAPFITTRYHMDTGEPIPVDARAGILDRKLAKIREHAAELTEPGKTVITDTALESTYGYEYQADSLIIARVNVLLTWADHWRMLFGDLPDYHWTRLAITTIAANLIQMDGLTGCVPGTDQRAVFTDWFPDGGTVEAADVVDTSGYEQIVMNF